MFLKYLLRPKTITYVSNNYHGSSLPPPSYPPSYPPPPYGGGYYGDDPNYSLMNHNKFDSNRDGYVTRYFILEIFLSYSHIF